MLAKFWMSKNLITVKPTDSVIKAKVTLKEHNISHLPVMEKGKLTGIVTGWDIRQVLIPSDTLKVQNIMCRTPITVSQDFTVGEAAEILLNHNISGLPVVDSDGSVVGIITKGDLLKVLIPLTGVGQKGIQFALRLPDRRGAAREITDLIRGYGGRLMSALTSFDASTPGTFKLYIRMYGLEREKIETLELKIMEKATILYMVDHRENVRKIYPSGGRRKTV
ncbi:MAG: CBS and ACT domain-containing protein [Desulfobacterales bacterium]|jgi:acetoin utilization protein AcuB